MECDNDQFIVLRGYENEFTFTIKQSVTPNNLASDQPMVLTDSDVFKARFIELERDLPAFGTIDSNDGEEDRKALKPLVQQDNREQTGQTLDDETEDGNGFTALEREVNKRSITITKKQKYKTDSNGNFLDINDDVTTVEAERVEVLDADSGKINLVIDKETSYLFKKDRASKTDRYYTRPTYRLVFDCDTKNNGKFIAVVEEFNVA